MRLLRQVLFVNRDGTHCVKMIYLDVVRPCCFDSVGITVTAGVSPAVAGLVMVLVN